jgi:hypothetical protein
MSFGIISALLAAFTLIWHRGLTPLWHWAEASGGLGLIVTGTVLFHVIFGPLMAVCGFYLGKFDDWARYLMVILCAMNLLNPPVGTAMGIYGLWVLLSPETEPLFLDPVLRRSKNFRPPH